MMSTKVICVAFLLIVIYNDNGHTKNIEWSASEIDEEEMQMHEEHWARVLELPPSVFSRQRRSAPRRIPSYLQTLYTAYQEADHSDPDPPPNGQPDHVMSAISAKNYSK